MRLLNNHSIIERPGQDELLSIRNDLMTVYREIDGAGVHAVSSGGAEHGGAEEGSAELFPLRYARATPRRFPRRRVPGSSRTVPDHAQAPLLVIPDGPGMASVLPYDVLRRSLASRGVDVLMMEHRGVGLSRLDSTGADLPMASMQVRSVLGDLLAVMDHARVQKATVYGVGYGAYLAQGLAALHPDRVHSLVLDSPLTGVDDEKAGQRALRAMYWDGEDPATATTAAVLRRLVEDGVVDGHRAGTIVLAVHEYGGPDAVRDLVDLLAMDRGQLTWNSIRQVLAQSWLESTPYVRELDLVAPIAHTELGSGHDADGDPMDTLALFGEQSRAVPRFSGEPLDMHDLSTRITAPTVVITGGRNLIYPPSTARSLAQRIPGASLLELPGTGHSVLDSHSQVAQVAARWSVAGAAHLLPERADELAALPATPVNQVLQRGLQLAMTAERLSPWRLRFESARARREEAHADPMARRSRRVRLD